MTYQEAVAYIASLEPRGWRLGLDRMQEFVRRAELENATGLPGGPQYIHVAGTNGKGSTTAYLQSLMVEAGFRTGAFFSPYVVDPRERIQFGRQLIPQEDFARLTEELVPAAESLSETDFGGITEFEFKTALGFLYWKREACDWVALEVGLGGRLDATNVVRPAATIVVSISLDHMQFLGETLSAIAYEKAGIIKAGIPCMVGDLPAEAMKVVEQRANEAGAPLWRYGQEIRWADGTVITPRREHTRVRTGIPGARQEINVSLAIAAMDAVGISGTSEQVSEGARLAYAPGRFEERTLNGKTVIFDGAHNPEAAEVLRKTLDERFPGKSLILVTNMLQGHELDPFYRPLAASVAHIAPIDFHRRREVADTARELRPLIEEVREHLSVQDALSAAVAEARPQDLVVVTGSFYLVGEALRSIGPLSSRA
jgi:dihydrofolate synthase/folylpolyglutamate synthase